MVFVGLSVQEVEVPLPTLLGASRCTRCFADPLACSRGPLPVKTSPLLGFWCKVSYSWTATTWISIPTVKVVQMVLLIRSQFKTGSVSQVRINADYTT